LSDVYDPDLDDEMRLDEDTTHTAEYQARKNGVENKDSGVDGQGGLFQEAKVEGGDQFMAVKPWKGAIKAPENWRPSDNQADAPNSY